MREFYLRPTAPGSRLVTDDQAGKLARARRNIRRRSYLVWAEHCSECAMPACFTTCEYYAPRMDLKCQRFENGLMPVATNSKQIDHAMSVKFKKWGKLEACGTARIMPASSLSALGFAQKHLEQSLRWLPVPYFAQLRIANLFKKIMIRRTANGDAIKAGDSTLAFMIEAINSDNRPARVTFTIRELAEPSRFFQKLVEIPAGYQQTLIPVFNITGVTLDQQCLFQIEPAASDSGTDLVFGMLDFVEQSSKPASLPGGQKVKCIIWDLDNTLWDGTLVEDGIDGITLRPDIVTTITRLDEMGILNSVASKNNHDEAMAALRRFGLESYFLYPQISWNPKSNAIQTIARSLNIGEDTLLFIDDQIFERTEVSEALPSVRVHSDKSVAGLLERPEFQIPVTAESRQRRKMYQENSVREQAMETDAADYLGFLKNCKIRLTLEPLSGASMNRVHELSQRTNQMNFSGNRYNKNQLATLAADDGKRTFVISCEDRFGEYGIVGFAIVDDASATLIDLMFSCRIQAKQVEHSFIYHLLSYYARQGCAEFRAHYKPTRKNAQSGKVFADMGFVIESETDSVQELVFALGALETPETVMEIIDNSSAGNHV